MNRLFVLSVLVIVAVLGFCWHARVGWAVVVVILLALASKPSNCQICGNQIRKSRHVWTLDGEKKHVCGNCHRNLERRVSSEAVRRLERTK